MILEKHSKVHFMCMYMLFMWCNNRHEALQSRRLVQLDAELLDLNAMRFNAWLEEKKRSREESKPKIHNFGTREAKNSAKLIA